MTVTISAEDTRSIKALELAATADRWIPCTARDDGRPIFSIPSQCRDGHAYLVDPQRGQCECQDFKRFGLTGARIGQGGQHRLCKHILAAQLHLELVRAAEQAKPRKRRLEIVHATSRYDQIFGSDQEPVFG